MKQFNIFRGLILTILLTCCNAVWAYDIEVDGIYYDITSMTDLTVEVTKGDNKYSGDIVIPSTITYKSRTFTVTSIGTSSFSFSDIKSISIPSSIKTIKDGSFSSCFGLEDVYIDDLAAWCNIDCCTGKNNNLLFYAENFYLKGELITELIIPEGVVEIKAHKFSYCGQFVSLTIPNSVKSVAGYAFWDCCNLDAVYVDDISIWCCIDFDANCSNPLEYANKLYANGNLITNLIVPDGITKMKSYAFSGYQSLVSVVIPNSVTNIGNYVFQNCSALASVVIGDGVTSFGNKVFYECNALEYIYVMAETPPSVKNDTFTNRNYINAVLYVPTGCLEAYQKADGWKEFWEIKEFDTTGISDVKTENKKETTIYDINGRGVENPTNGIYIVDGKKVLLR